MKPETKIRKLLDRLIQHWTDHDWSGGGDPDERPGLEKRYLKTRKEVEKKLLAMTHELNRE